MTFKFWAGTITPAIIAQQEISTWALQWANRAAEADRQGKQLIVFEVPKNDLLFAVGSIEGCLMQDIEQPADPMLYDITMLDALFK